MFMNQRVRMLKEKIIEHHGRVEDIVLYNIEPSKDELLALKKQEDCRAKLFDNDAQYLWEIFDFKADPLQPMWVGYKSKKDAME